MSAAKRGAPGGGVGGRRPLYRRKVHSLACSLLSPPWLSGQLRLLACSLAPGLLLAPQNASIWPQHALTGLAFFLSLRYLVMKSAWPSMLRTVAGDHHRFEQTYFSHYA